MALDAKLLEILACPDDKGPLLYFIDEDALYNPRLQRRYRVQDDIPIMLIDEAETVDAAEHDRLMQKAAAEGIEPTFDEAEKVDVGERDRLAKEPAGERDRPVKEPAGERDRPVKEPAGEGIEPTVS
jgi:uncharacterized protein YbaR (Trm112 family)